MATCDLKLPKGALSGQPFQASIRIDAGTPGATVSVQLEQTRPVRLPLGSVDVPLSSAGKGSGVVELTITKSQAGDEPMLATVLAVLAGAAAGDAENVVIL